jgi:CDP-diacylglycerol---glycerol-3-phosphate 3-phosphatidyltransferase
MINLIGAQRQAIFSRLFGNNIARARNVIARGLIRLHVNPDILTILGLFSTIAAAVLLAYGAGDKIGPDLTPGQGSCRIWAALLIILASSFDILDGAVAKLGGKISRRGGFLDSTVDRISDAAVYVGIMIYYQRHPQLSHAALLATLTVIAMVNAETISYVKARAENFIPACPVGYWQRGERLAGILIGLFCGHTATVMIMLAVLPVLTAIRRIVFSFQQIHRQENQLPLIDPKAPLKGIMRLAWWRYRRGSPQYDVVTAINISMILFIDAQRLLGQN